MKFTDGEKNKFKLGLTGAEFAQEFRQIENKLKAGHVKGIVKVFNSLSKRSKGAWKIKFANLAQSCEGKSVKEAHQLIIKFLGENKASLKTEFGKNLNKKIIVLIIQNVIDMIFMNSHLCYRNRSR